MPTYKTARTGDFIKDCSPRKRSMGYVRMVDEERGQMYVEFPKINERQWVLLVNRGQYIVIE